MQRVGQIFIVHPLGHPLAHKKFFDMTKKIGLSRLKKPRLGVHFLWVLNIPLDFHKPVLLHHADGGYLGYERERMHEPMDEKYKSILGAISLTRVRKDPCCSQSSNQPLSEQKSNKVHEPVMTR